MKKGDERIILAAGLIFIAGASVLCFFFCSWSALIIACTGVFLTLIFKYLTRKRYKKISDLNYYLDEMIRGNLELSISSNEEGELSLLQNNLYKVMTMLRTSNEVIKNDRNRMSDSMNDISHQLKTPLTSIMIISDLIKVEENPEKRLEMINVLDKQLDKMKWLITTLLKISKLEANAVDFKKEMINVREIVDESLETFLQIIYVRQIDITKNVEEFTFSGDRNWTQEAIMNLIKNCIEHLQYGGHLTITAASNNICNEIIIEDDGSGIAKEDLPHIFERFYHGKNSSKESVGIGLALTKMILEKEHGAIEVASEEGIGTKFTIKFYKTIV